MYVHSLFLCVSNFNLDKWITTAFFAPLFHKPTRLKFYILKPLRFTLSHVII